MRNIICEVNKLFYKLKCVFKIENADDKSSKRLSNTKTIEKFIGQEEMENEKQRLEKVIEKNVFILLKLYIMIEINYII